jgi:NAD(P)-dependent dehydrogenase (short-subunit alcohol dehydrogenase family)
MGKRMVKEQAGKRVVLITGASSGIGDSVARCLVSRGYKVYGTSRKPSTAGITGNKKKTAAESASKSVMDFQMLGMDVTDTDSIDSAVQKIISSEGRLDILINNAGIGFAGSIEETTNAEAMAQFDTNFFGVHRMCRAVIPQMRMQGSGHIVNIGSMGGEIAIPFQAFYSASKAALAMLSDGLSMELKPFGITVSRIDPGDYKTAFTDNRIFVAASTSQSKYYERCQRAVAVMEHDEQNGADPEELARFLANVLEASSPKTKYRAGLLLQRFMVGLAPFLPARTVENLLMKTYNID